MRVMARMLKFVRLKALVFGLSFFLTSIMLAGVSHAGHLFTQASSNTPTWIQAGQGISIDQYGTEGSSSGRITMDFAAPSTTPSGADNSNANWWTWSAGDVMEITLPLTSGTYKYSIAYDSSGSCTYDFCGVTGSSSLSTNVSELSSGVSFPTHSGEKSSYTSSDTAFQWSVVSLAGEFSLAGYRIYTNAGTIDGTGSGPLDQSSVVTAEEATSGGGAPTTRDINATGDTISNLVDAGGSSLNSVFDGGELLVDQDLASSSVASFAIKSGNGNAQLNVASGETHSVGSKFTDNGGDAGVLEKVGAGTLVLTNTANDYTGGTVVSAGTLEISSDSALGASSGGLTLSGGALATTADMSSARSVLLGASNGVVDTAAATELTLSGVVSGTGSLTKTGAGVLTVTGTNTYTGGTTVSAGTLRGAVGSLQGDIANNASVEFAQSTDATYSDVVSGTGSLTKTGAGVLTVTGTNTYTGGTTVSAGTLDLDGSLTSSVAVASTGRLEGVGSSSGGLTSSGVVAPGNSPGTLSFAGNVTFEAGNTFVTELDGLTYSAAGGAGSYDRLAVTGATATFTAGGTLSPVLRGISAPANNDLVPVIGDDFRVVTTVSASGVTGAFSAITDPASGMPTNTRFDVLYGGNYVDLVLTPDDLGTFAEAYGIQNMVNAANALDTVRPAQGTNGTTDKDQFFNGLYGLTASQVAQALLQASGEIHAFALSDARDGWQSGVGVVRSASQDADRNYWLDVSGYDLSFDEDSIASSYDGVARRLWIGTDVQQTETYALGVAVGVSNSDITTAATGSAEVKTTSLALYMNGSQGAFEYDGILSVNRSEVDTTRTVGLLTGPLTNTSSSNVRGAALSAQVGYRYDIENSDLSSLVWLRGDVDTTKADGFAEDGTTVTSLTVAEQTVRSTDISLGYTMSGGIKNGDQEGGTWSLGLGASKTINSGMPYAMRTISLHDATWEVSVPQSGEITRFASAGIDLPIGEDANVWLNVAASKRDGSLAKSAAFGFQVEW